MALEVYTVNYWDKFEFCLYWFNITSALCRAKIKDGLSCKYFVYDIKHGSDSDLKHVKYFSVWRIFNKIQAT